MKPADSNDTPIDGRRARGQANRSKLVAAMIELVREGSIAPTAEQVAARAQVALRTVFRHFDDMESLYREIDTEVMQLIVPLINTPFSASSWRGRLDESIARRARLFETILPFRIATEALRHQSAFLQEKQRIIMQMQHATLLKILPGAALEDAPTLAALNLLLSVNAWQQLRMDQGLDTNAAEQAMRQAAKALTATYPD
ncbi:TetR/AcrR family transcriptional regulator [Pseudomonas sp. N040]|uniref:TetR/AcrR family transcriptional regulator n=1 Tax=Pseudomonas sp. N040 TaxID=2785325 RepID=UPI0018A24E3F|nr:TetR/AcrR family transcriptional regulator [Pseudomonas sp. N040]MBF7731365.1 TetR family transcriptional regulator [Pseudomonas sp. N040]MBW7015008.1 TetR/AcrR family transcriptional regulator [Pseudomonas sp. N040]